MRFEGAMQDGYCIGGPAHGQRWPIDGRRPGDRARFRIVGKLPMRPLMPDAMKAAMVGHEEVYRLALFRCGSRQWLVWVPEGIPDGFEIEHILGVAMRCDPKKAAPLK
jgi:hypothetical protein